MAALEAVTMANLAQTLGVRAEQLVIEPTARKTWQNLGCLHSRLLKVERVFVVSDSLHAQRAALRLPPRCASVRPGGERRSGAADRPALVEPSRRRLAGGRLPAGSAPV